MLRRVVLEEHLHPPRLLHPWLFVLITGWLWLQHSAAAVLSRSGDFEWDFQPTVAVGWMLLALVLLWLTWALLVQLRRIDAGDSAGFILAAFGVWSTQSVDTIALVVVDSPPHHMSAEQLPAVAAWCIGGGYVAYAIGVGLVIGGAVASWRTPPR